MVIGVPTGTYDKLEWNAHRVYGPILYPYLMTNWKFQWSSEGKIINFLQLYRRKGVLVRKGN